MENRVTSSKNEVAPFVDMFEEAEEASTDARALANRCRDYHDAKQLTDAEKAALTKRGQPHIVINRIRGKINWLRGLEMQSRTDPKAFPRTPQHEQSADAATDALRYVCDNTNFDKKRSKAWNNLIIEGICGVEVIHKPRQGKEPEIVVNHYQYDRLFYDPHSVEDDFSDARYKGVVIWSECDDLKRQYPDKVDEIEASINHTDAISEDYEDKPHWKVWSDPRRKRVRVVLIHYLKEGRWHWAKFVKGGVLEGGESMYLDEDGNPECPLIMQSAYVDRENNRQGVIVDWLDPQDEINKRRSKLLHSLNSRQTMGVKGAVKSVAGLKRELAQPDGHVEINYEAFEDAVRAGIRPFEVLPQTDQTMGQFNLLQEAKNEIDMMGASSALSGKDDNKSQSGRAWQAQQQGGMIEMTPMNDNIATFTRAVYRQMWNRVRQFWTQEKWIRVTDDERNIRFVGLNKPITLQEKLQQLPPEQVQQAALQMRLVPGDPRLQQVVGIDNSVAELDVDIMLEEVPDVVSLQSETFEQVINIATSMPGSVPPEILLELAPNIRRDVKDRILEMSQKQQAAMQQQGQQQAHIERAKTQSEIQESNSKAALNLANVEKANAEAAATARGY